MVDAERHYWERLRAFQREHPPAGAVVLLGSSHFEWFDAPRFLPGYRWVNRGIASDRLGIGDRGIHHGLPPSGLGPALIIFNNGVNDLGELHRTGRPPLPAIDDAYERVVATIRDRLPDTPLLIVNELPTAGRFAALNPLICRLNRHIARVAQRHHCPLLDAYRVVVAPPEAGAGAGLAGVVV